MVELENVLSNYLLSKASNDRVPGQNITPALLAIRKEIPDFLQKCVETSGLPADQFFIRGSPGEPNRSFALVPWVAIFHKPITRSAQRGYYIVVLFSEDMSSVWISLNQGYTAFGERYIDPALARRKLGDCARAAVDVLEGTPVGFETGPITLHANGELGKGYEAGAIFSKRYDKGTTPSYSDLEQDIHVLLSSYMKLSSLFPTSLIDLDLMVKESDLQTVAENFASKVDAVPSTTGAQPPPAQFTSKGTKKYVRSPAVSARALAMSGAVCALSSNTKPHTSFTSAKSKKNYVEAHHIVPFSQQSAFPNSLDVEENIAALCPNCHRMLHYGTSSDRLKHLKVLYEQRELALKIRGIEVNFDSLKEMYGALSDDD